MKTLFEFEKVETKEDGSKLTHKYALLKPSHSLKEEAEELNAIESSKLVQKGVLTRKMLRKKLLDAGIYSESEKAAAVKLYEDFDTKVTEFRALSALDKNSENEEKLAKVNTDLVDLRKAISAFEMDQVTLFDTTAEVIARNRVLFWWTLVLLLEQKNGKYVNLFSGKDYTSLKVEYDNFVDGNSYNNELLAEVGEVVTLMFLDIVTKKEDFEAKWKSIQEANSVPEEPVKASSEPETVTVTLENEP